MSGLPQPIPLVPPPVLASAVRASVLGHGDRRLEAENYLIEGYRLRQRIEVAKAIPLSVFAKVWQPNRLKGTQVAPGNGKPFLAATQVFAARPSPRKWLSIQRTPDVEQRYVKPGWILVTCSGSVGDAIVAYRPIDASPYLERLDWLIVGGESGPIARPFNLLWARSVVAQCKAAGVPCFVKQLGRHPVLDDEHRFHLRDLKGGDWSEWPADLRVRDFPTQTRVWR